MRIGLSVLKDRFNKKLRCELRIHKPKIRM